MKTKNYLIPLVLLMVFPLLHAQRISVSGNEFRVDNNRIWINGSNTPWIEWNDFGGNFSYTDWNNEFQRLKDAKVNCTRVWLSHNSDGHIQITNGGYVQGPTNAFWDDVDDLFEIARNKQIYLIVALISFDHTRLGSKTQAWKNMYNNASNRQSFINNYAKPLIDRYKGNPYFFAVETANEIEWVFDVQGVNYQNVQNLVARVAKMTHDRSNVLVTQGSGPGPKYHGGSGFGGFDVWSDNALNGSVSGAYLDFFNYHHYDWMTNEDPDNFVGWKSPLAKGPNYYNMGGKPAIVGEIAAKGSEVDLNINYSNRDVYKKSFEKGWEGVMSWTSTGVDRFGNLDDAKPGLKWIHDNYPELVYPNGNGSGGPEILFLDNSNNLNNWTINRGNATHCCGEITLNAQPRTVITSKNINIKNKGSIKISTRTQSRINLESNDFILFRYRVQNNGTWGTWQTVKKKTGTYSWQNFSKTGISGDKLKIRFVSKTSAGDEFHLIDWVKVESTGTNSSTIEPQPILDIAPETISGQEVTLYPNPVQGNSFNIGLSKTSKDASYNVAIYDITGRMIFNRTYKADEHTNNLRVDLGQRVLPGAFFVNINNGGQLIKKTLIMK